MNTSFKSALVLTVSGLVDVEASVQAARNLIEAEAAWQNEGSVAVRQTILDLATTLKLDTRTLPEPSFVQAVINTMPGGNDPMQFSDNSARVKEVLASLKGDFCDADKPLRSSKGVGGGLSMWTPSSRQTAENAFFAKQAADERRAAKAAR